MDLNLMVRFYNQRGATAAAIRHEKLGSGLAPNNCALNDTPLGECQTKPLGNSGPALDLPSQRWQIGVKFIRRLLSILYQGKSVMYQLLISRIAISGLSLAVIFSAGVPVGAHGTYDGGSAPAHNIASDAYASFSAGDYQSAAEMAQWAVAIEPTNGDYLLLLADAAVNTGDMATTRAALRSYSELPETLPSPSSLDMAYRAMRANDDDLALHYFARARAAGELTPAAALDAAYAARRLYRDADTVEWLAYYKELDSKGSGAGVEQDQRENAQALYNQMTQRWQGQLYFYSGPAGQSTGGVQSSNSRNVIQTGVELSYSPSFHLLRRDGGIDIFARYFITLYDSEDATTGGATGQPASGLRWRPMRDTNLVLEYARFFKVGSATRDDNLFRIGFSTGSEPKAKTAWKLYAEANYFTEVEQTTGEFNFSYGWNVDMSQLADPTFFNISLVSNYDSSLNVPSATSFAPGISHRFALDERDKTALDLTFQYRFPIAGDTDRARGPSLIAAMRF